MANIPEFMEWLQAEMDKREWKQADLVRMSGLSPAQVSNVLNDLRDAGPDFCKGVSRAFGIQQKIVFIRAGVMDDEEGVMNEAAYSRKEHKVKRFAETLMTLEERWIDLLDDQVRHVIRPHLQGEKLDDLPGKKSKGRSVFLGKRSRTALWLYLSHNQDSLGDDMLFTSADGSPLTRNGVRIMIDRVGKAAGVEAHPHKFRHTFALQYLRNGGDVFTLQRLLGHSTLEMVRRYVALSQADDATAHRRASPVDRWQL